MECCTLTHALKWLSPLVVVDIQPVPDGCELGLLCTALTINYVIYKLVHFIAILLIELLEHFLLYLCDFDYLRNSLTTEFS